MRPERDVTVDTYKRLPTGGSRSSSSRGSLASSPRDSRTAAQRHRDVPHTASPSWNGATNETDTSLNRSSSSQHTETDYTTSPTDAVRHRKSPRDAGRSAPRRDAASLGDGVGSSRGASSPRTSHPSSPRDAGLVASHRAGSPGLGAPRPGDPAAPAPLRPPRSDGSLRYSVKDPQRPPRESLSPRMLNLSVNRRVRCESVNLTFVGHWVKFSP